MSNKKIPESEKISMDEFAQKLPLLTEQQKILTIGFIEGISTASKINDSTKSETA